MLQSCVNLQHVGDEDGALKFPSLDVEEGMTAERTNWLGFQELDVTYNVWVSKENLRSQCCCPHSYLHLEPGPNKSSRPTLVIEGVSCGSLQEIAGVSNSHPKQWMKASRQNIPRMDHPPKNI